MSASFFTNLETAWEGRGGRIRLDDDDNNKNNAPIDPALDDCCRREIESNRRYNALTRTLQKHDVLAQRERQQLMLVQALGHCKCCVSNLTTALAADGSDDYLALADYRKERQTLENEANPDQQIEQETRNNKTVIQLETAGTPKGYMNDDNANDDNANDDDDDAQSNDSDSTNYDYLLDDEVVTNDPSLQALEERRRLELEWQLLQQEGARCHGYGVHTPINPQRATISTGWSNNNDKNSRYSIPPPPFVVLHLYDPLSRASASLDYYLEKILAPQYLGTKFVRVQGNLMLYYNANLKPSLTSDDLPAMVALKNGQVLQVCKRLEGLIHKNNNRNDDNNEIVPDVVHHWLDCTGVLDRQAPSWDEICNSRPEEQALLDHMARLNATGNKEVYNCGVPGCEKDYPHEHVGINTEEQTGLVLDEDTVLGRAK